MRYGRALLAGLGWAGTLGGLALCVLIFLSAYLAFDDRHGVEPREDGVLRLPSVPDAEVPPVPLARPPSRIARDEEGGRGGGAPANAPAPRPGARTTPRPTAPVETTPQAPLEASPPAAATPAPLAPAAPDPPPGSASPLPPPPTLGDTTREVVGAVGTGVGRISPPAGQVIEDTGDTLGDAVDALTPRR